MSRGHITYCGNNDCIIKIVRCVLNCYTKRTVSYILQHIFTGFLVKSIASFDDTLTRIPILAELTKTLKGKVAFSIGTLLGLTVILIIAIFFSSLFAFPFRQQVLGGLIALLSVAVYFELFVLKENSKLHQKFFAHSTVSHINFLRLLTIGFVVAFITFLDDALVLIPLFVSDTTRTILSTIGIYLAALVQILLVIFFSKQLERVNYKKEMAAAALLILAVLVGTGLI